MSEQMPGLPGPRPDPATVGYWEAAGRGELVVQRCSACGTDRHPPTQVCYVCNSLDWTWEPHSGRGRVFSYTWVDRPILPALAPLGAYNTTVVELEGTTGVVRILSRVTDAERDDLAIGMPVEVHFDPVGDGVALPVFRTRTEGDR